MFATKEDEKESPGIIAITGGQGGNYSILNV